MDPAELIEEMSVAKNTLEESMAILVDLLLHAQDPE